jgi:DNA-binding GntR family transcriptional regulator
MEPLGSVKRPSLREQVADRLREAILDGRLKPGQKLIERELCELLDISRTLLREALQQIQAEGLITSVLHRGPAVAMIGADEVSEIYEVREALEALAGAAFARNASDDDIRLLRERFEALKTPAANMDARSMLLAKNAFYSVLLERCGNRVVAQILTMLNNRMMLFKRLSLSAPGRTAEMIEEVGRIVVAIEDRNPKKAGSLCAAHVASARKTVMGQLQDGQSVDQEDQRNIA